jgi:hypothetical protein
LLVAYIFPSPSMKQENTMLLCCLSGAIVSMLAIGPKVQGIKPGSGQWIFKGDKIQQHAFLRRVSKVVGPMS